MILYTVSDLSKIKFVELELQKSIFSEEFKFKKRIVGMGIDFDNYDWKANETIKKE